MVTTDFIQITGLEIFAYHGVLDEEKQNGQKFYINARLYYSMKKAADTDDLRHALNYADCCAYITDVFKEERFDLIEAYSMTTEAIVTKLMWILGQTKEPSEIRKLFYQPIHHDIII